MPPKDCEPWLYEILRSLQASTQQSAQGLASITRGEVPDGSGDPLGVDLSDYFYLPGRPGGQDGSGGSQPQDDLILRSTADDAKGKIFLGEFSAYDEANILFGINITAPIATLHIVGSLSGTSDTVILTNSDINSNWGTSRSGFGGSPIGDPAWQSFASDDDETSYVAMNVGGPSGGAVGTNPQICGLDGVINPGTTYTVTVTVSALFAIPTHLTYLGIELVDSAGDLWRDDTFGNNSGLQIPEVTDHSNFHRVTRSVTCSGTPAASGQTANSLRIYLAGQDNSGLSGIYMAASYIAISQSGADLIRWDMADGSESGRIDLFGQMGVGTEADNLTHKLTVRTPDADIGAVLIKGASAQVENLVELVDSSDTALSGFTSEGNPYLIEGATDAATLTSDSAGVGSWATLVSWEDEAIFYEDSPVYY